MADARLTDKTLLDEKPADADLIHVVDVSNSTDHASGSSRKVTRRRLVEGLELAVEAPVGTVDDSNLTFTVSNAPLYIVVNGAVYVAGTGIFASYATGTITLSFPVGTGGFIRSFYKVI